MRYKLIDEYYHSAAYFTKLQWRGKILNEIKTDQVRYAYWMNHFANGGVQGIKDFIELFAVLKIPEYDSAIKPFFLFEYQDRVITKIVTDEMSTEEHEILIDKPRGMGVTWILVWIQIHHWLFWKEWSAFDLSRTETEVDDGSNLPDGSIFGKVRWALNRLPPWIMPKGFKPKVSKGTSTDMTLRLVNPQINASLNGSSTNANAGRSRRYNLTFVDEAFFVENFMAVYASLQSVSRIKIFVSTVIPGTRFKKMVEAIAAKGDYISLSWKDHPFKDQIWYDDMLKKAEFNEDVMKEIEPSYTISKSQQYYPEIEQAITAPLKYNAQLPLYISIDVGKGDLTVLLFWQYDGKKIYLVSAYSNKQRPFEWYMPFLFWGEYLAYGNQAAQVEMKTKDDEGKTIYNAYQMQFFERIKMMKRPVAFFGELAHRQRNQPMLVSVADMMAKSPYRGRLLVNTMAIDYETRRKATAKLLPMMVFNDDPSEPFVGEAWDAMVNSRYAKTVAPTSRTSGMNPVHDAEIADYRAAVENFAVNFGRIIRHYARNNEDYRRDGNQVNFRTEMLKLLKQ